MASRVREAYSWTSALAPRDTTSGLVRAARSASASRARISGSMARTPNRSPAPNCRSGREGFYLARSSEHVDRARFALPSDTQQERGLPVGETPSSHADAEEQVLGVNAHTCSRAATRILPRSSERPALRGGRHKARRTAVHYPKLTTT